jgi:hypothetical protein
VRKLQLGLACVALLSMSGCSPDSPLKPKLGQPVRSALVDAPGILAQAEARTLGRYEQDQLVRFERQLPGFGGLYLANGAVRVYMKSGSVSPAIMRLVLTNGYSAHPDADVREAMKNVATATVVSGQYALSELIAIQRRIEASFTGWTMVGTNIMENKVVVAFPDSQSLVKALGAMESAGVPAGALTGIVMARATTATVYFTNSVRPPRAGLVMHVGNDTYEPHKHWFNGYYYEDTYWGPDCTMGFNVHASSGDYFLTAGHCENEWRGQNGATGDTIFQNDRIPPNSNSIGQIVINPPWSAGTCPNGLGGYLDFCTDADVALGQYSAGNSGDRKLAVSTYGGVNGNPGNKAIKNWYNITRVLPPEYVDSIMRHETGKSGGYTYTTSGPYVSDMADVGTLVCWPKDHTGCHSPMKQLLLQNQTVIKADFIGGDSGSPVFTGDPGTGAPYAALGILVSGNGPYGRIPEQSCPTCTFAFSRWSAIEARIGIGTLDPRTIIP